jgi:hypothetical protein
VISKRIGSTALDPCWHGLAIVTQTGRGNFIPPSLLRGSESSSLSMCAWRAGEDDTLHLRRSSVLVGDPLMKKIFSRFTGVSWRFWSARRFINALNGSAST